MLLHPACCTLLLIDMMTSHVTHGSFKTILESLSDDVVFFERYCVSLPKSVGSKFMRKGTHKYFVIIVMTLITAIHVQSTGQPIFEL